MEAVDTQTNNFVTGDPAFAVDRRGVVVSWNSAAEKTFGHPGSEALGRKCWRLLSGKDLYGNRYCCRHCPIREMSFRNVPVNSFQSFYKTTSGQDHQFAVSCLTISDQDGSKTLLHICRSEDAHPEETHTEAVQIPAPAARPARNQPGTLSKREIEVLRLLAANTSTRDIATTLSISIRTVRTHIQHVMYKLQVHKRVEAVEAGKRLKLIPG